jgi:hypothetical protein
VNSAQADQLFGAITGLVQRSHATLLHELTTLRQEHLLLREQFEVLNSRPAPSLPSIPSRPGTASGISGVIIFSSSSRVGV